jgi:hypothetical protein
LEENKHLALGLIKKMIQAKPEDRPDLPSIVMEIQKLQSAAKNSNKMLHGIQSARVIFHIFTDQVNSELEPREHLPAPDAINVGQPTPTEPAGTLLEV